MCDANVKYNKKCEYIQQTLLKQEQHRNSPAALFALSVQLFKLTDVTFIE